MKNRKTIRNDLFKIFLTNGVRQPQAYYVTIKNHSFTYNDVNSILGDICVSVLNRPKKIKCVAINSLQSGDVFFFFWAGVALGLDIVLAPGLSADDIKSTAMQSKLKIDLFLSDDKLLDLIDTISSYPVNNVGVDKIYHKRIRCNSSIYFFSSGTTGKPKFIRTTYYQFIRAMKCILNSKLMEYTHSQSVFIAVPLSHSYGLSAMVEYTQGGSHIFIPGQSNELGPVQSLLEKSISQTITAIEGVPYFYKQILILLDRISLPRLKHIGMGGDLVSDQVLGDFDKRIPGLSISVRYGVTEIPSFVAVHFFRFTRDVPWRYLGRILPIYTCRLHSNAEENGEELVVECAFLPSKKILVYTNDIVSGYAGTLTFIRRKMVMKVRGYRVNPVEIESHLNEHPDIRESKVYMLDEILMADLVLELNKELEPALIREYLAKRMTVTSIPNRIQFVERIIRTRTGKIIR